MNDTNPAQIKGQYWALGLSTTAFTLCFAAWTIFSIIGIKIKGELGLTDSQIGLLMATPILTGSISRLFLGILTDRFDGRYVFATLMMLSGLSIFALSLATSYVVMLIAALGIGLAGGSFIVGVAYTSSWFESKRQGLALGIFGAGNVGSSVTNLLAPLLLLVFDWQGTAQIYSVVMILAGILFLTLAKPDPGLKQRKAENNSLAKQLAPLADLRVWRFSLYYFFVFGAFVALALWLPRYAMEVYGLTIVQAGVIAALFTIPGSIFRIYGGWLSDKYGARRVMYWTLTSTVFITFILSYPPTRYTVQGIEGPIDFGLTTGPVLFSILVVFLGFFMSLGKAAVFKHIPRYYPKHVGSVGGVVGMIGGLGGFFLPITFGMLNDVVGIWQSCFMLLFFISASALAWMHYAIYKAEIVETSLQSPSTDLPELSTPSKFVLTDWRPEDSEFWETTGKRIAKRNLWISIPNLFLAFAVWSIWSILVVKMPQLGFSYTSNQLFWLAALPSLSGATLRVFYSFMVPIFGGRRWTAISSASLLLPCIWLGFTLQNPDTPYLVMLVLALLCGFGGGNFASSMANISFFYPQKEKGGAMGLNAGLGNLGVSGMQLLGPLVISASILGPVNSDPLYLVSEASQQTVYWLQNAALLWVPLIIIATLAAWFGMNDIASAKSSFKEQAVIFKRSHTWLMCWLYLGAFGSFIGFAAGFPLLSGKLFPEVDPTKLAFLGPLLGALARPLGGILADKLGGARVTFIVFLIMALGVMGVMQFLPTANSNGSFQGFFIMFLVLFIASGVANGSTFRMVPIMFRTLRQRALVGASADTVQQAANKESAAVLGFISAFAAYGGFFIPKAYGTSFELTGGVGAAFNGFLVFYLSCILITWWFFSRKNASLPC